MGRRHLGLVLLLQLQVVLPRRLRKRAKTSRKNEVQNGGGGRDGQGRGSEKAEGWNGGESSEEDAAPWWPGIFRATKDTKRRRRNSPK
ncbi:unnamed protein product [Amoebophrya sp. A25]|nr:unnamed protein product [Amoebophrya sp. A25]|eukprot:GSA25T00004365001.1